MKQNKPNEYAIIDLENYERLTANSRKLDTLLFYIDKSTKYSISKKRFSHC